MKRHRSDDNQQEIVAGLRKAGCHVTVTSMVGNGFGDAVVGIKGGIGGPYHRATWVLEIKDGAKKPSARKLTEAELKFKREFCGNYAVVTSLDDALIAVGLAK